MSHPPVVIDGRAAARARIGGVERLARELVARLPRRRPERYRVALPPRGLAHRAGHAWEQLALPLTARRAPILLCPANLAPLALSRTVVVIHDAAALRRPDWYGAAYVRYQRLLLPALARRARHLVTVSEFSRGELVELLGVHPSAVSVIPNGTSDAFRPDADPEPAGRATRLVRPYALVVGARIARKNLPALGAARKALAARGVELVAAGAAHGYMRAEPDPPVRPLGYVAEELMPGLYAGARALLMPSLYEGFGLPCLEAMACGTPVVAADRAALPETCAGAALLVDPRDAAALADAAVAAATDEALRGRLRGAGLARAPLCATLVSDAGDRNP